MGLATLTPDAEYNGDGVTVAFSYPYKYVAAADLKVYLFDEDDGTSALQTLSTHYSVTPGVATNGVYASATITFVTAPGSDKKVRIFRDPALTQEFDFDAEADPLPVLTRYADYVAMRLQALDARIDRAPSLPPGSVAGSFDPTLPDPTSADGGEVLALNTAKTALIWATGVAGGVISSVMADFVSSASKSAARTELAVPGLADQNTFTEKAKWIWPYTTTGDSIIEVTHGDSSNPVTTIQSKHSGIRVERWLNKTGAASSTQETGVQADALSAGSFLVRKTSGSQQTFALKGMVFIGTPRQSGAGSNADTVGVYGEAQRTTGSDGVWAANFLTETSNLSGPSIICEFDSNNKSGADPGVANDGSHLGISVISGAEGRGGTAIYINRNGAYSNNEWNRGVYVKEVKKIGIEVGNVWEGAVNAMLLGNQGADGEDTILIRRKTDSSPTGVFLRCVNAANSSTLFRMEVTGRTQWCGPSNTTTAVIASKQIANGENNLWLQRFTDSTPTGQFICCTNAANSANLFMIDMNSTAAETNMLLSVAGAACQRVSVGANDSGGSGFRLLRVAN